MNTHVHILHAGSDLETAARVALEAAGEQWTAMRASIYHLLAASDKPASAYDIADQLARSDNRRVAANSVYRILDLFVAKNLAKRIESSNAYIVNAHPGCQHDCIFLLCDGCGMATHVDDDNLAQSVRAAATGKGFLELRPMIEVRGRCAECGPLS
jgi:Fur family transcriptional regulator, zinc uptake regulator